MMDMILKAFKSILSYFYPHRRNVGLFKPNPLKIQTGVI
ncbi:hypothetical protein U14_01441 [Candidatus Moduliflexus flocculans]|uniref:Uncharacterized protein n=1 Tax=Candidatus Moduliflexus flocculans TaxID=1499966 RepID=A0A0S6VY38_9BACT|nr:hypothetical protein U14_01441 [Candidatus Moduliflexus flocculans]